jgi:hypothetical protein
MTTWVTEDLENARKKTEEEEYSGGIPIPFAGWMQQDKDDTEEMLRHQLQILQAENHKLAKELTEAGGMIGVLREYISDLENGLESSIKLNKAQAERQEK